MSAPCAKVVSYDDDDRNRYPRPVSCQREATANVQQDGDEWCACEEHAAEAESDGHAVERWL